MGRVLVGVSGWDYPSWRGRFYPAGLPRRRWFEHAARRFPTLELNCTFYGLQRPAHFQAWHDASPPAFRLAVKGSRYITHVRRLRDVDTALANFFASGLLALAEKLGPILWQLPPGDSFDVARVEPFLAALPRTAAAAGALARRHDARLAGRALVTPVLDVPLRHAVEARHPSYFTGAFSELLRAYDVAFVVADAARRFPTALEVTSSLVYVRLHGSRELYVSGYGGAELDVWARRCGAWARGGRDVVVYFDNTAVHAPGDALGLMARVEALCFAGAAATSTSTATS